MKTQAQIGDLTETMARILETGRCAEWEFRDPECAGGVGVVRGGTFEVSADFRDLVILASKAELAADPRPFGRLTLFATDGDEVLYLHCATLVMGEPETIIGCSRSDVASGEGGDEAPGGSLVALIARVFCVQLEVPSHSISVLARSEVTETLPTLPFLVSLGRITRRASARSHPRR